MSEWPNGLAEWTEGGTAYLSIAFTWRLPHAYMRACWYRQQGFRVVAGGPALFTTKLRGYLDGVAEYRADYPDAIARHNPKATIASRGCPVGCYFCIVPAMEGRTFTLLPDFPVRPILCDNNLSALPADYQRHVIDRYKAAGVWIEDANSGFEPRTFDDEVYARWREINRGPWRFAYDDQGEREYVLRVLKMLKAVVPKRKRVYTLIGNEPKASCLDRINEVIALGAEPHAQPYMKLNALQKKPHVRFDWLCPNRASCPKSRASAQKVLHFVSILIFLIGIAGDCKNIGLTIVSPVKASTALDIPFVKIGNFTDAANQKSVLIDCVALSFGYLKSRYYRECDAFSALDCHYALHCYWPLDGIDSGCLVNLPFNIPQCDFSCGKAWECRRIASINYRKRDSDRLVIHDWINLKLADDDLRAVGGNKFGASQPKLETINRTNHDSRNCKNPSKPSKIFVVSSESLFGALLLGAVTGIVGIVGGAAVLWRLWGV